MTDAKISMRDEALSLAARGWRVVALHNPIFDGGAVRCSCGKADCSNIGKHPRWHRDLLPNGLKNATTDPQIIKQWWGMWPDANIAIVTGEGSGLAVIDLDIDKATGEFTGLKTLAEIEKLHGETPATLEVTTGSGGIQQYFAHPGIEVRNSQSEDAIDHIDFRGDGGYVVAPPSLHASGRRYRFSNSKKLQELPIWVLNWRVAKIKPLVEVKAGETVEDQIIEAPKALKASLNGSTPKYVEAALRSEAARVIGAREGTRNAALNRAGFSLGTLVGAGVLDEAAAVDTLTAAGRQAGLGDAEIAKTLKSGIEAGKGKPRDVSKIKSPKAKSHIEPKDAGQAGEEPEEKKTRPTDDELVDRWLAQHPDTAYGMGEWRRYASGWWQKVDQALTDHEQLEIIKAAKSEGIRPTSGRVESVRTLAKITVGQAADAWDANNDIIVCQNGTLDISTMTLREWSKDDLMTSAVEYDYDPAATCPMFLKALNESVPEAHDLLQEFAGYALTTDTRYELALWLFGKGGSGKSTIIEGFMAMLGKGKFLNLGLGDIEKSPFALARLPGKTLAISTEQPSGLVRATDTLNKIISGEPVQIEKKFQDAYEIRPRAKILWAMNELPRVSDPNNGLFRRVKIVKFPDRPEALRDVNVKEIVKTEGAGVLNWAVEGLRRLRENGRFTIPATVEDATKSFRESNDIPAKFVEECCIVGPDKKVKSSSLYKAYKEWCVENGHKFNSSTTIAEDWKRLGFEQKRSNGIFWAGIGLLEQPITDYLSR